LPCLPRLFQAHPCLPVPLLSQGSVPPGNDHSRNIVSVSFSASLIALLILPRLLTFCLFLSVSFLLITFLIRRLSHTHYVLLSYHICLYLSSYLYNPLFHGEILLTFRFFFSIIVSVFEIKEDKHMDFRLITMMQR